MSEPVVHTLDFHFGLQGAERLAYLIGYAEAHGSVTLSKDLADFILRQAISDRRDLLVQLDETDKLRKKVAELKKQIKEEA